MQYTPNQHLLETAFDILYNVDERKYTPCHKCIYASLEIPLPNCAINPGYIIAKQYFHYTESFPQLIAEIEDEINTIKKLDASASEQSILDVYVYLFEVAIIVLKGSQSMIITEDRACAFFEEGTTFETMKLSLFRLYFRAIALPQLGHKLGF